MNTSFIALGIAATAIAGLVATLGGLSLLAGSFETLFGKPKLTFLKSGLGRRGFAFLFEWNEPKEPAKFNLVKIRLFNPFGSPTQVEVSKEFEKQSSSFCKDFDMGPGMETLMGAKGFEKAIVQVELFASDEGVSYQFDMKGLEFKKKMAEAKKSFEEVQKELEEKTPKGPEANYGVVPKNMIADTVPGKGPQLKIITNPVFTGDFSQNAAAGGAGGAAQEAKPNFAVKKVWIDPGCIVCNACEDIYPEVFDVQTQTCYIRPNAPLDDGLKIQEAAEACPVEVIKFEVA